MNKIEKFKTRFCDLLDDSGILFELEEYCEALKEIRKIIEKAEYGITDWQNLDTKEDLIKAIKDVLEKVEE